MSYAALCALVVLVLFSVALVAAERGSRPPNPIGVPTYQGPVATCQRCGRANLAADTYGRPLPHFAATTGRAGDVLCGFGRSR